MREREGERGGGREKIVTKNNKELKTVNFQEVLQRFRVGFSV